MEIIKANIQHAKLLAPLFDAYRVFYRQTSDPVAALQFTQQRLTKQDSTIFLALKDSVGIGFTQLYPSFSSINMQRIFILNDLYIAPDYRKKNIARQLLRTAKQFALANHAIELVLSTERNNDIAQKLYHSEGYIQNTQFLDFSLTL
ncbi:MAG: GNAT family N-acetyltransferase [Gammaproteobacteria bacterium]